MLKIQLKYLRFNLAKVFIIKNGIFMEIEASINSSILSINTSIYDHMRYTSEIMCSNNIEN